jgi:hypothetical protein
MDLYDYFTDITYITDKYSQLFDLYSSKDNNINDIKLKIKNDINKKYGEMEVCYEQKIRGIIQTMALW